MTAIDEYDDLDATALAGLVRAGGVHPRELIDAAIDRAEARNPQLNAIVHTQFDRAREDCGTVDTSAPFPGVPFLLKDYAGWEAGERYDMGVRTLHDRGYRATSDSDYARRIRAGGLIPIGRTNTPELAVMGTTEPALYGPTHNPWGHDRTPGGSSGGSAAAVAARIVPVAHGNDISGSIRLPASMCGLVGLKPTRGRALMSEPDSISGMMVEGVVTRTVRDTAGLVDWLSHRSPLWPAPVMPRSLTAAVDHRTPGLRVGVWTTSFNGSPVDASCAAAAESIGELLTEVGHHVEVAGPAALAADELWEHARTMLGVTAAAEAARWTDLIGHPLGEDDLEPRTWSMVQAGQAVSGADVHHVMRRLQALSAEALDWWQSYDVLLTPTTAAPPFVLGEYLRQYVSGLGSAFTRPINVTGQPAVSVPAGWGDDGLPRGVQIVTDYGRDDLAIELAATIEAARPWADRRPDWISG
jgi:amidase